MPAARWKGCTCGSLEGELHASSAMEGLQAGSEVEGMHVRSIAAAVAVVERRRVVAAEGLATGSASVREPPLLAQVVHCARTIENADA
jgi:hypothetical protein